MVALSDSRVAMASSTLMRVADLDEQVDDRHVVEIADVRDLDFDELAHVLVSSRSDRHRVRLGRVQVVLDQGGGDLVAFDLPASASAFRAASVTQWRSTSKKWRSFSRVSERPKPSVPSVT
jgi:hypothetical protein